MSTRCLIGKENKDKSITYIYCHHDGYPTWVGKTLLQNYQSEEKIDELLKLGDMSVLGTEPLAKEYVYDDPREEREKYCEPYSLRGEDCQAVTVKDEEEFLDQDRWQEYYYLYKDGKWYIADDRTFEELTGKICGILEESM